MTIVITDCVIVKFGLRLPVLYTMTLTTKTGKAIVQQDDFSNGHYLVERKASTGSA